MEARVQDLSPETQEVVAELADLWSQALKVEVEVSPLAVRLLEALRSIGSAEANQLVQNWGQRVLDSMKHTCRQWLAENYADLDEAQQQTIITALAPVHEQPAEIGAAQVARYKVFMEALSESAKTSAEFTSHFTSTLAQLNAQQQLDDYVSGIFSTLASLLPYADANQAAQTIDGLFTNTQNRPPLYAQLHKAMVNHWPSTEETNYNATQIFDQSVNIVRNRPGDEGAPDVLDSINSMVAQEVIEHDRESEIVEAACATWPHHFERSVEVITHGDVPASPNATASLAEEVDLSNAEVESHLSRAWTHIAKLMNEDEQVETVVTLLRNNPDRPREEPDRAIRLWLDSTSNKSDLLDILFGEQDLADEHLKRLWLQAQSSAEELGLVFFTRSLPQVLLKPEVPETTQTIIESQQRVNALVGSDRSKANDLGDALLSTFAQLDQDPATQRAIGRWMQSIGAGGALRLLGNKVHPSAAGVRILQEFYESSNHLQRYKNQIDID